MAFQRPTLAQIVDRVQTDFVSRLALAGAVLRRSMVAVLSRVVAGASHMLHGHLDYLGDQLFADTADAEHLERLASMYGVVRHPSAFAEGALVFAGTNGTVIPAGTAISRSDGAEYETTGDVTVSGGTAAPYVVASVAGADGNAPAGAAVTLQSPIAGVTSSGTVGAAGLTLGSDEEGDESLRERLLDRLRDAPQGGAATDYLAWAREVAGVTRAWVYPRELGAGTVTVRFMRDEDLDPVPNPAAVAVVQAHIDTRAPVTAVVTVAAPVPVAVPVTLSVVPDTVAVRQAVEAELIDLLRREAAPGETLLLSRVRTAIGIADGLEDYTLSAPAADVPMATGQIAQLGVVTWL